jgi:hypothetical protein
MAEALDDIFAPRIVHVTSCPPVGFQPSQNYEREEYAPSHSEFVQCLSVSADGHGRDTRGPRDV